MRRVRLAFQLRDSRTGRATTSEELAKEYAARILVAVEADWEEMQRRKRTRRTAQPEPRRDGLRNRPNVEDIHFPDTQTGRETEQNEHLKVLAGQIYAELGGNATVRAGKGNALEIVMAEDEWKITLGDDGRVQLGGFPQNPGLSQYIGEIDEENILPALFKITTNAVKHIQEASEVPEPEPPIEYPSAEEQAEGQGEELPPLGMEVPGEDFPEGMLPEDLAAQEIPEVVPAPAPAAPLPVPAAPGMAPAALGMAPAAPGMAPAAPGLAPAPAPFASKRAYLARYAACELDTLAGELQDMGLTDEAKKLDAVTNSIEAGVRQGYYFFNEPQTPQKPEKQPPPKPGETQWAGPGVSKPSPQRTNRDKNNTYESH